MSDYDLPNRRDWRWALGKPSEEWEPQTTTEDKRDLRDPETVLPHLVVQTCPRNCGYRVRVPSKMSDVGLRQHIDRYCPLKDAPLCPEACAEEDCKCSVRPSGPRRGEDSVQVEDTPYPVANIWGGTTVVEFQSGLKRDTTEGKVNWSLVYDGPLLRRWAQLMTDGAKVKGKRNWMNAGGVPETQEEDLERFREGAARHFAQWMAGETNEDHAAAVVFNVNGAEHVKDKMRERAEQDTQAEEGQYR